MIERFDLDYFVFLGLHLGTAIPEKGTPDYWADPASTEHSPLARFVININLLLQIIFFSDRIISMRSKAAHPHVRFNIRGTAPNAGNLNN